MTEWPIAPLNVERGYVTTCDVQLHYATAGSGFETCLFLLHETPRSWTQFGPAIPHLAAFSNVFAIDSPGYGLSEAPSVPPSINSYTEMLVQAIQQLAASRPVWVAGVHTGALFAATVKLSNSIDVAGLVLTGLPLYGEYFPIPHPTHPLAPGGVRGDAEHFQDIASTIAKKWQGNASPHLLHDAVLSAAHCLERSDWAYRAVFSADIYKYLPELSGNTVFLSCETDPLIAHDNLAVSKIPGAKQLVAQGISRDLPWLAPKWYSTAIFEAMSI